MKKILVILCSFFAAQILFAQSLEDYVDSKYLAEIKSKGNISLIHEKKDTVMEMVPFCKYTDEIKSDLICTKGGVPFLAEFLYVIPKKDLADDISKVNSESIEKLFRSLSKMEGMTYIHNGGKEDILYKKCYAIASPDSDTPISDPLEGEVDGLKVYAYQHDHTFGHTKYEINYYKDNNVILLKFINQIPMGILGIKAVKEKSLKMNVMCIDIGEDLLLYLSTDVKAKNLPGIRGQIEDSMTVRMDAVYKWFMKQFK
ncbi:MAG: hypothetical protein MSH22_03720 [Spirochaetia bacterium]|nr:hypothetical protein [Spirochaetia bacterium]MCI7435693.1 hypothetical protein [Spirochaetia bacterium]MDY2825378.1 DUF6675 family protein [Treponema sp.]